MDDIQPKVITGSQEQGRSVASQGLNLSDQALTDVLSAFAASPDSDRKHRTNIPTIERVIGLRTVGELDRAFLRRYVETILATKTSVGRPFTPATVAAHFSIMRRAIYWWADMHDIPYPKLPFSTKLLPRGWDLKRDRRLSLAEQQAIDLRGRSPGMKYGYHWRLLIPLALETGARLQELAFAEWSEFDLVRRVWSIPESHAKGRKARAVPLTRKATRTVALLSILKSETDSRLFHPFANPASISAGFRKLTRAAGVTDFRFHDLRHEAISRLVLHKRKLHVFEIMKIVGHSSSKMLDRYANLRADELVDRME